jgi:glycosyltransferase involved in cell wall biosynthesis
MSLRSKPRSVLVRSRSVARSGFSRLRTEADWAGSRRGRADIAIFHEFDPPPTGGGHQFLRALVGEFERRGLSVEANQISGATSACLFNSFNFDFDRLRRFARGDCRMVHRVDGPISVYRGYDDGTDERIAAVNRDFATATIVQSRYSLDAHRTLGIELERPVVIPNAVDARIFHPPESREPLDGRKVRLIAVSWSDNPNKGADIFEWLDRYLDWDRFEFTFVGRARQEFDRILRLAPMSSALLAAELGRHDIYIAASRNDPSSNALLEALACGLPVAYRASGGHPELVGDAGVPFQTAEEVSGALDQLVHELDERRAAICIPSLADVGDRYLEVLSPPA